LTENRRVLELGAGAGLPSLVCALRGNARTVVVTDYPEPALIENLRLNVEEAQKMMTQEHPKCDIIAQGYLWGADTGPLLEHLDHGGAVSSLPEGGNKFDLLILGDLLFNHSEHTKLLLSIRRTLARSADARAVVFFTPYRPWLLEKDLAFFELVQRVGSRQENDLPTNLELSEQQLKEEARMAEDGFGPLKVDKVLEHLMDDVMFKEDRGDEKLRRTVSSCSRG
jgi:nicotinamide N-methyltransferase